MHVPLNNAAIVLQHCHLLSNKNDCANPELSKLIEVRLGDGRSYRLMACTFARPQSFGYLPMEPAKAISLYCKHLY